MTGSGDAAGVGPAVWDLSQNVAAVSALLDDVTELRQQLGQRSGQEKAKPDRFDVAARRLSDSVIRPLNLLIAQASPGRDVKGPATSEERLSDEAVAARLWQSAKAATALRVVPGAPALVCEATAALQDLACQFAPETGASSAGALLGELTAMQAGLKSSIQSSADGPYLVTNASALESWLGLRLATRPQMALCRCGASAIKPWCDGSHAKSGFSDAKDPRRVPDRRDEYTGVQVTVFDNRGTCAHSGFCSDRVATAFRVDQEPFVAPSGGRMDEIIRAVRDCPSGALSYALDGTERRDEVDQQREPVIVVSKDGPYRITGGIQLLEASGHAEPRNQGASLEHYSLCRCGHSQNKPFCSGMHWYVKFKDPVPDPDKEPTLFEWAGGFSALLRMTRLFYEKYVPQDPLLAPLFARMSPDHPERVASWLSEVFGGPTYYSERYGGYSRMISQHVGKCLTEAQRSRWVSLLSQSAQEAGLPADPEFRAAFTAYLEWGSRIAVENSQQQAHPPQNMPMPRWWWVCNATPGSRVSALAPQPEEAKEIVVPAPGEPVGFVAHIKPMFRESDRQSMRFAFDLWSYADVKTHASGILERLSNGSMPCDGAWPAERVDVFRRWVESGMSE